MESQANKSQIWDSLQSTFLEQDMIPETGRAVFTCKD